MDSFLYMLTIIELCIFTFTLCCLFVINQKRKNSLNLKLLFLSSLFIVENLVVYINAYTLAVFNYSSENIYFFYLFINLVYILLVRLITKDIVDDPLSNYEIPLYVLIIALQILLLMLQSYFLFLSITSVVFLYIAFRAMIVARHKKRNKRSITVLLLCSILLGILVIVEDKFLLSFFPSLYANAANSYIMSISLNVLNAVHCVFIVGYCYYYLKSINEPSIQSNGFVRKDSKEIMRRYNLTSREMEIMELLFCGKSNKEIADELFISVGTVKSHTHNIFAKCDVTSRKDLYVCILNTNNG